ncbi:MAG: Non-hemolytic phospholipase C [Xylophilus sp.]|nr:MAG: Non-hemolytic phospholipase C [Xylophilus sp.]
MAFSPCRRPGAPVRRRCSTAGVGHGSGAGRFQTTRAFALPLLSALRFFLLSTSTFIRMKPTLGGSGNWYDFSVQCSTQETFARRFAGRVENGRDGVSDPAMGTAG